jgi:uncharacterized protein (AIM24 family)
MELQIIGGCNGYANGAVFRLSDGSAWQQTSFINEFQWTFGATVSLENFGGAGRLFIHGHSTPVDVTRIS